jgi:hypothetical protein
MPLDTFGVYVDGLVTEARDRRDAAINAVDAVDRETRRDTETLARQVDRYVAVHEATVTELERRAKLVPRAEEPGPSPTESRSSRSFSQDDDED